MQAALPPKTSLRQDIELLRLLGIFGVVWYHAGGPAKQIACAGIVIFSAVSTYLSGRGEQRLLDSLKKRAPRLLVPWGIWFLAYGLLNLRYDRPFIKHGLVMGTLEGTSIHLWYLPFIFVCLVLLDWLKPRVAPRLLYGLAGVGVSVTLFATPLWREPTMAMTSPLGQYMHAFAALLWGVFCAEAKRMPRGPTALLAGLALVAAATAIPFRDVGISYLVGLVLCLPLLSSRSPLPSSFDLTLLSRCTMGVYLSHGVTLLVVGKFFPMSSPWFPALALAASLLVVLAGRAAFPKLAKWAL